MTLKLNNKIFDLSSPLVMGIVNVTPDSFYAASRQKTETQLLSTVERLLSEGAHILDIGGYSSRPSAPEVCPKEEVQRLTVALELILKHFPNTIVSVDTFRSEVAALVVQNFGVSIINDISGGTLDKKMFETIANLQVAYVLMHMRGTPSTMQELTQYDNLMMDVVLFLQERLNTLRNLGVNDVIVDPGFGFAKTLEQNYTLLKNLSFFRELDAALLVGVSRKSMIYKVLDTSPEDALNGTTATNMLALIGGASILRVHDVKEAVETIKIFEQYKNAN